MRYDTADDSRSIRWSFPRMSFGAWAASAAMALAFGVGACQSNETSSNDTGTELEVPDVQLDRGGSAGPTDDAGGTSEDVEGPSDTESTEGDPRSPSADTEISCTPGEIIECSQQNSPSIIKCQEDGTGTIPSSCTGTSVCREGECVDVFCVPGRGRCKEGRPQTCNQEGSKWIDKEACGENSYCSRGACLNRCENAAETNSYVGCEYWAVELENRLLFEENEGNTIPDDRKPPFAIVLANKRDYNAKVTIWEAPGEYAEAVGSRTVEADTRFPGSTLQTVHSELIDGNGNRIIKNPIDGPIKEVPLPGDASKMEGDEGVPGGSMLKIMLPHRTIPDGETTLESVAYKIETTQPVVAYQFNPYCCNYNYTNDASLLLPKSALTTNYMYMGAPVWAHPRRRDDPPRSPTISVMATEPDTDVTVQLREPDAENRSYSEAIYPVEGTNRIDGPDSQGQMEVTMEPFEVLNIAGRGIGGGAAEDFTGARITSDKPISTFGAHSCTFVPFSQAACDHLESQLQPMETWGTRFVASPLKLRAPNKQNRNREGTYWKFVARKDDTQIETGLDLTPRQGDVLPAFGEGSSGCHEFTSTPRNGVFTLDAGESCEFGTKEMFVAESTQPILLGAFLSGQESVGENVEFAGDPSFFIVPPVVQYRSSYSFLTPDTYESDYVTLTIRGNRATFELDGETIAVPPANNGGGGNGSREIYYEKLSNRNFSRVHIPVEPGPHQISSRTSFGIVAYGYHNYVSYAYTGGLDLAKQTQIQSP